PFLSAQTQTHNSDGAPIKGLSSFRRVIPELSRRPSGRFAEDRRPTLESRHRAWQEPADSRHVPAICPGSSIHVFQTRVQTIGASGCRRTTPSSSRPSRPLVSESCEILFDSRHPLALTNVGEITFETLERLGISANPAYFTVALKRQAESAPRRAPGPTALD